MASSVNKGFLWRGLTKNWIIAGGVVIAIIAAMAIDSTVVVVGSDQDLRKQAFSSDDYGRKEFPRIQKFVSNSAPDAIELAADLKNDKKAAVEKFATMAGAFPVFPVKFTGVVGEGKSGIFELKVEGFPDGSKIRVQTGPAINGTELRDIPGDIEFGAFTNQIEYQNVGAGINKAMSAEILADIDHEALTGKSVSVVGAFKLINPKNWLVTPVEFSIK